LQFRILNLEFSFDVQFSHQKNKFASSVTNVVTQAEEKAGDEHVRTTARGSSASKLYGQRRRADKIAKHHCELAIA
jgi:hypothetical protein